MDQTPDTGQFSFSPNKLVLSHKSEIKQRKGKIGWFKDSQKN